MVAPGQCASDLALTAAERLFQQGGFDRSFVDALFFVSQSPDYRIPTTSAVLHQKLSLPQTCATMDINLACSAFPYTLSLAHAMIVAGTARHVLVLNADAITTFLHPLDRSLVALHGDAACATLVGPCEDDFGFGKFTLGTDGTGAKHLLVPAGGARIPLGRRPVWKPPTSQVVSTRLNICSWMAQQYSTFVFTKYPRSSRRH